METKTRARAAIYRSAISASAKLVALYLIDCTGGAPSMRDISEACSMHERTVRRCCREMEVCGLLIVRRFSGTINDYQVMWGDK